MQIVVEQGRSATMRNVINDISKKLLEALSEYKNGNFAGAYSFRQNGKCIGSKSSKNVEITSKTDKQGIIVRVKPDTKGEVIFIPSCVTEGGIDDTVYNDFYVGENCDITIKSGCGVHTDDGSLAKHNGIHRFFVGENAKVHYEEKHIGTGKGEGIRSINPVSEVHLEKDAMLEINATQISGIDKAYRKTTATVAKGAKLNVHERLFTECSQVTKTNFKVELNGEGSSADIVSRSVARDDSYQTMDSVIIGNAPCTGHSECDSIVSENAIVDASPRLFARNPDASLIHEAAIGKIAGEQILKLRTFGLTEEEAENEIIQGFLS